jgi:hypothetical protein
VCERNDAERVRENWRHRASPSVPENERTPNERKDTGKSAVREKHTEVEEKGP